MLAPDWWKKPRLISIVVDSNSWILPFAERLAAKIQKNGDHVRICHIYDEITEGSIAFFLGCTKIALLDVLALNKKNLIVHESDLPSGRGFAPMTWQILEGKNIITFCLLEAEREADSGPVIYRDEIKLEGHELNAEWRELQGMKTIELCERYLSAAEPPSGHRQSGMATTYARRRPVDSRLDPNKTISSQFDLLRVVDNDQYPAFFDFRGCRYKVFIEKEDA